MKLTRLGIAFVGAAVATALVLVPVARAQDTKAPAIAAAPLPEQLATATSVFISYGGADGYATTVLKRAGDTSLLYNEFYAAMKKWGRYQLAASPTHADLIIEVRFTLPLSDCGKTTTYSAQVEVAILDGKTHFVLWTLDEPVEFALRIATWERNISEGVTNAVGDLQRLVAQPVTAAMSGGQK
jgi:hypothetical protein